MPEFLGREVIFTWGGVTIPGIREKGINLNGEPVDVTSDDDLGWRRLLDLAGQNQIDITISGMVADIRFKRDFFTVDGRIQTAFVGYPDGNYITGEFFLVSVNDTLPYNEAAAFEAQLQSSGMPTFMIYS